MPDSVRALVGVGVGGVLYLIGAAAVLVLRVPALAAVLGVCLVWLYVGYLLYGRHEIQQDRKAKGLCLRCGYDLTGNVSGVCPECGKGV